MELANYVIGLPEVCANWPDGSCFPLLFSLLAPPQFTAFLPLDKADCPSPEQLATCLDIVLLSTLTTGLPAVVTQQPIGSQALDCLSLKSTTEYTASSSQPLDTVTRHCPL